MTKLSLTPEELQDMISKSVAAALAAQPASTKQRGKKTGRHPLTDEQKAVNRAKIDAQTIANFKAAGYDDVQPRVNVMTYNKWVEAGRRVKKGAKAIKCGNFPLFHLDQTEPLTAPQLDAEAGTVH